MDRGCAKGGCAEGESVSGVGDSGCADGCYADEGVGTAAQLNAPTGAVPTAGCAKLRVVASRGCVEELRGWWLHRWFLRRGWLRQ